MSTARSHGKLLPKKCELVEYIKRLGNDHYQHQHHDYRYQYHQRPNLQCSHCRHHHPKTHACPMYLSHQRGDGRRRMRHLPQCLGYGRGFLCCWTLEVARTATVATMYSSKPDSMTVKVCIYMWHQKTYTEALLDSGATHNFIDKWAAKKLGLETRNLPHLLWVNNVDSTENQVGSITEYCNLWLQQGSCIIKQGFYIANLGNDRIILGHPWFHTFNPTINWEKNQLQGDDIKIETAGYQGKKIVIPSDVILHAWTVETPNIDPSIPEYYHWHWKVFDDTASHHFPPAREEDHAITLKPGAPDTLDCKIYQQTEVELQTTKDFIHNELAKGYIEESNSPYVSPLFYWAKKDGKLRPIMDYKALNSWTVCDTYPLPHQQHHRPSTRKNFVHKIWYSMGIQ